MRKTNKTATVKFRCTPYHKRQLKKLCKNKNTDVSKFIYSLVLEHLAEFSGRGKKVCGHNSESEILKKYVSNTLTGKPDLTDSEIGEACKILEARENEK